MSRLEELEDTVSKLGIAVAKLTGVVERQMILIEMISEAANRAQKKASEGSRRHKSVTV
jgi:hypothetical protein